MLHKINTLKTAYKIGFSTALEQSSSSAYSEVTKWPFERKSEKAFTRLKRSFYAGFKEAVRVRQQVRTDMKEFIEKGEWNLVAEGSCAI
jgi:hypothetical protein